jgi:lincosamide nucleotidyltransferase A/C/D/E
VPTEFTGGSTATEVLRVIATLDAAGLRTWVAGGWGVDALLGRQTRVHRDLDLALDVTHNDLDLALSTLEDLGYLVTTDWRPSRVELAASPERFVDLHPVVFDDQGTGWQTNVDDLPPFRYPRDAFSDGFIDGTRVACLSVTQQLLFHSGYPPRPHDVADLTVLHRLHETTGGG